jgi:RNA polymerase sigma-70 factor (ECF subfamily)
MSPAAMGQRLSRAKTRLREAGATFSPPAPDEIEPHLPQVMEAILAAAALGWEAVPGSDPGRADLSTEALWLAEALAGLAIAEPEPQALLALLLYIQAREPSRRGRYTPLGEQDTSLWNRALIARADQLLSHASTHNRLGRFQCEAAIQSALCEGRLAGRTNWAALRVLHAALGRFAPSSGGAVAAAAVTLELDGPAAALAKLDALPGIKDFQPAWALRAEAEARAGNRTARDAALRRALGLAEDPALRAWLAERLTRP